MKRHDLKDLASITLLVKAETMDRELRVDRREPKRCEAVLYGSIVEELEHRQQYTVSTLYRERYNRVYAPHMKE